MKRSITLRAYVSPREKRQIARAAKKAGDTISGYLRSLFGLSAVIARPAPARTAKPEPGRPATPGQRSAIKFRVDEDEMAAVASRARELDLSIPNAIRVLCGLPPHRPGAPRGNKNHTNRRGANQHTAQRS